MKEKIKAIRQQLGMNQSEFGKKIGASGAAVSRWESGERSIPNPAIRSICLEFGIREEWLRNGTGPMKSDDGVVSEMTATVERLFKDRPESFKAQLIRVLLRYGDDSDQWQLLENIFNDVAGEALPVSGAPPDELDRAALHGVLDRHLDLEKGQESIA